jgi:hypothetical protein
MPPPNNFGIRASAAAEAVGRPGHLELDLLPRLWEERQFALHHNALVSHVQSHGAVWNLAQHYRNGRASAGLSASLTRGRRLGRWVGQPVRLVRFVVRALAGKGRLRSEWASLPVVAALAVCHIAGEIVGTLRGAGDAPRSLS